jgi:hypothetical protein
MMGGRTPFRHPGPGKAAALEGSSHGLALLPYLRTVRVVQGCVREHVCTAQPHSLANSFSIADVRTN